MTDCLARIDGLHVRRPGFELEGVTFEIPRGATIGLVGPNGAGKTTTIRALLGLLTPDGGTVTTFGLEAGASEALVRTGIVLDRPTAAPEWKVDSLARRIAPFYPKWDGERLVDVMARLSVPLQRRVGELSRGEGIKLTLAMALAQTPDLLILDEPSSGLDPASRREISALIREFMVDPAHGTLLSTHITSDLDDLADELVVLVGGRIAHRGALPDVLEEFAMVRGSGSAPEGPVIGLQRSGTHWEGLIRMEDSAGFGSDVVIDPASIDDIVVHLGAQRREVAA